MNSLYSYANNSTQSLPSTTEFIYNPIVILKNINCINKEYQSSSCSSISTNEIQSSNNNKLLGHKHTLNYCSHNKCLLKFKSKKQRVHHHDKLDIECRAEKTCLLELIEAFNKTVSALRPFIDEGKMHTSNEYTSMIRQYESSKNRIINKEQLEAIFVNNDT